MVDGPLMVGYACAFSSTVPTCSTAAAEPFVATLMASTPRVSSREAGTFAAGQVISVGSVPDGRPSNPYSGNAAALAPTGQRPRAGTAASCAHETTPAGTTENWVPSDRGIEMVSRGFARTTTTPWTPGIPLSCAVSGAAGAAGPTPVGAAFPWDSSLGCWSASWSVTTDASAGLPDCARSLASCVVMNTTATVVRNRASTRPLTARKAALGSSARRRAAISALGRLVHRAMTRLRPW